MVTQNHPKRKCKVALSKFGCCQGLESATLEFDEMCFVKFQKDQIELGLTSYQFNLVKPIRMVFVNHLKGLQKPNNWFFQRSVFEQKERQQTNKIKIIIIFLLKCLFFPTSFRPHLLRNSPQAASISPLPQNSPLQYSRPLHKTTSRSLSLRQ